MYEVCITHIVLVQYRPTHVPGLAFLPGGHTRLTAQSSRPFIEFCSDLLYSAAQQTIVSSDFLSLGLGVSGNI